MSKKVVASILSILFLGAGCSTASVPSDGLEKVAPHLGEYSTSPIAEYKPKEIKVSPAPVAQSDGVLTEAQAAAKKPASISIADYLNQQKKASETEVKKSQKYSEALAIYRTSGFLIQFVDCHGNPGSMTIKKGANFMIDNRDADGHVFKVGKRSYGLGSYEFMVVSADTVGTLNITCDGGGAATLKIQS